MTGFTQTFQALREDHDDFDADGNDMTKDEATLLANAKTLIQAIKDDPEYENPGDADNTLTDPQGCCRRRRYCYRETWRTS